MSRLVDRASRQSVERRLSGEPSRHSVEELGREQAVVVGEGDEIRADVSESGVTGAGQPSFGVQPDNLEMLLAQDRFESIVIVLVDEQHAKGAMRLRLQGGKQALELADTADGRDDEVK